MRVCAFACPFCRSSLGKALHTQTRKGVELYTRSTPALIRKMGENTTRSLVLATVAHATTGPRNAECPGPQKGNTLDVISEAGPGARK